MLGTIEMCLVRESGIGQVLTEDTTLFSVSACLSICCLNSKFYWKSVSITLTNGLKRDLAE
jgi:hypothetical protein